MRASCAVGNVALGLHWALCFLHRRCHAERELSADVRRWALTHASTADGAQSAVNGVVGPDGLVTLQTRYTAPPCAGVDGGEVNRIPTLAVRFVALKPPLLSDAFLSPFPWIDKID